MSIQRSILTTFMAQAPTLVLYFMSSMFMTNVLGDDGRGAFALLQNIVVFTTLGLGFNFTLGLMYHTARSGGDNRVPVGMAASVFILNALVVPALLIAIASVDGLRDVFFPGDMAHPAYYGYVLVAVLLNQLVTFIGAIAQGLKLFAVLNRMSILLAALTCAGSGSVWAFRHQLPEGSALPWIVGITLAGMSVHAALWCVIYVRHIGLRPIPIRDPAVIRPFMAFALTGHLINLINLVNYRFDIWVVNTYAGTANLGLYAVAVGVGQLFFNIPEPLSRVVQPYLYAGEDEAMMPRFKAISRLNFTSVAVLCAIAALAAPWVLPMLFGPEFIGSVNALRLLLPGILFVSAYKLLATLLTHRGLLHFNLYGSLLAAILTVGLDLILIPRTGIQGAAVASTISYLAVLVVTCLVLRFRLGLNVMDFFFMRPSDIGFLRTMFRKTRGIPTP